MLNVMDLLDTDFRGLVHPVPMEQHSNHLRTAKNRNSTNISKPQSRENKDCNLIDKDTNLVDTYGVCHELISVAETLSTSRLLSKINLQQTIESEGVHGKLHLEEGGNFRTPEGSTLVPGKVKISSEKDLSNIVKQNIVTSKRRKSTSRFLYDMRKPTVKIHIGQRLSKRKRKQAEIWEAISAVHKLAKKTQKSKTSRHKVSINSFINQLANLACLANGELNHIQPLAFAVSGHGSNPNI